MDRRSSSIAQVESHAEPDSAPEASGKMATFKIEEDDDEGVEEETSYQRRLSSRSSTTSTEKVKLIISYLCVPFGFIYYILFTLQDFIV